MKTIKFLTIIALCSVIIYGCSTKSDAPPHLLAVPKNAGLVLSLNGKQMVEKAGLNKQEEYKCLPLLKTVFEAGYPKIAETINNFLKNTRTSGLNLDQIFAYLVFYENQSKNSDPYFGITFLINDLKTFEDFIKTFGADSDIESKSIFLIDEGIKLQWNDKIAIISGEVDNKGFDIFNENEAKSVLANESFKSEYSEDDDAYVFIEYSSFPQLLPKYPHYAYNPMPDVSKLFELYKDLSLAIKLNAEKGEFVATAKLLPAEKGTALFEKFYKTDLDKDLYNYFPDKSLLALKFAIKPLDIYNEYKKYFGDIDQYDQKVTSILDNFTGDFLGSLSGISMSSMPDFAIAAGITKGKEKEVTALMEELGFVKTPKGYYALKKRNPGIYLAVNHNAVYLTGSIAYITDFVDNHYYASNITTIKDFGEELKNSPFYFYWDININHYPAILKSLLAMTPSYNAFTPLLEKLKSINVRTINTTGSEFKIKFTENEYSSKIILKELDKIASQYLNE